MSIQELLGLGPLQQGVGECWGVQGQHSHLSARIDPAVAAAVQLSVALQYLQKGLQERGQFVTGVGLWDCVSQGEAEGPNLLHLVVCFAVAAEG